MDIVTPILFPFSIGKQFDFGLQVCIWDFESVMEGSILSIDLAAELDLSVSLIPVWLEIQQWTIFFFLFYLYMQLSDFFIKGFPSFLFVRAVKTESWKGL